MAEIIQITIPAKISNGQWTHKITLEIIIKITEIKKINQVFVYFAKNKETRKATLTAAWSEGKLASGICSKISFQAHSKTVSGLSILTRFWIIKFIAIAITHE
jgi:hypothetical protein